MKRERSSYEREDADRRDRRENDRKRIDQRQEREKDETNNPFLRDTKAEFNWGKEEPKTEQQPGEAEEPVEKEKPNFGLSGKLTADTNTFNGVVVKYSEPPEARKPKLHWRLFPFKGDETMDTLYIHRQSAYLVGKSFFF